MMSSRTQTTESASSTLPLERCCCCCSLKEGVFGIAIVGILNGILAFALASLAFHASDQAQGSGADLGSVGIIFIFAGIIELLRSAVGIYASSYEDVASAKVYMFSFYFIIGCQLLSFLNVIFGNPSANAIFSHLVSFGLVLYFSMVVRSYYLQLKNKNQGSALHGDMTELRDTEIEMA